MNKIKTYTLGALFCSLPIVMNGQEISDNASFHSHGFVQLQGGLHLPFSPGKRTDLIQPNFGVGVGAWFAPTLGARINAEGLKSKVLYNNRYQSFNYITIGVDAMFNLSPLFVSNNNPRGNLYVLGGIGLTRRGNLDFTEYYYYDEPYWDEPYWDEPNHQDHHPDEEYYREGSSKTHFDHKLMHNLRLGIGFEYKIAKPLSVSLEYRLNNTSDEFNGRLNNKNDWNSSLLLGVSYNFYYSKTPYYTPEPSSIRPLSLFEQMQQSVKARMNTWMKRLKGESKEDYLTRTTEEAMEAQRLQFTRDVSTEMAGNRINTNANSLTYNLGSETLGVGFTDMPSIALKVPRSDVKSFKNAKDLQFSNTVYNLNPDDKFEVLYTDVINPATGKKYTYIKERDAQFVSADGYVPLEAAQQDILNNERLQQIKAGVITSMKQETQDYTLDNTVINVTTALIPTAKGADYKITYTYNVKEGFSAKDDFAPGRYEADKNPASKAMLQIINQSLKDENFAKYINKDKTLNISYTGSADAKPIHGKIPYNGRYGNIKDQEVKINGQKQLMTITPATGITSNEQLSLVRAIGVKDYIKKNITSLQDMKVTEDFNVEVSSNEGSQFRRVAVDLLFHDVY